MILPTMPRARSLKSRYHVSQTSQEQNLSGSEVKLEKVDRLCRRNRRGTAAVEFALVAPVFFLLVFGMIEFGRMVMVQQVLTNASREGARIGVLDGTTTTLISDTVENYLISANISSGVATIQPGAIDDETGADKPYADADYGDGIEVMVSVPFGQVSWLPSSFFGNGDLVLSATSVMRRETIE